VKREPERPRTRRRGRSAAVVAASLTTARGGRGATRRRSIGGPRDSALRRIHEPRSYRRPPAGRRPGRRRRAVRCARRPLASARSMQAWCQYEKSRAAVHRETTTPSSGSGCCRGSSGRGIDVITTDHWLVDRVARSWSVVADVRLTC